MGRWEPIEGQKKMSFDPERLNARLLGAHSDRLVLRAAVPGDAIDLFDATCHPGFNEHLMWAAPASLADVARRLQRVIERAQAGVCAAFSAVERSSGRWVALFRFEPREQAAWAEMGLWSHPAFWGAGHGEEVTRLAIDRAFSETELAAVVACAKPQHKVSMRLLERCGLEPAGIAPRTHESGHQVPLMQMLLTRTRWQWLRTESITCGLTGGTEAADGPMPMHATQGRPL
jgi:RimJ/RimL family protein N-acetyltransferase